MTSDYVIVSIICPEVGNGEYIILLKFGGRSVSGFEDIEGVLPSVPAFGRGNRVNIILCIFSCFPSCNDMMTFFPFDFQAAVDKRLASWKNDNDKLTRCLHQSSQAAQTRTLGSNTRKATWRGRCTSLIWGHNPRVQPTWTGLQSASNWG